MKIIISNAYCYLNKGDAGIIRAMVQEFKKQYPESTIKVISLYSELDQGKYGDCEVIGSIIKPYKGKNRYLKIIRNILYFMVISLLNLFHISFNQTIKEIKKADIVVSCGGGYFKARSIGQFLGDFMYHLIQFTTCIQLKKKYVIYAQTIGEFGNKLIIYFATQILKRAQLVLPRESISYNYTKKLLKNHKNYYQTSDIAFLLEPKHVKLINVTDKKLKIGLTMRSWHFPGNSNREELLEGYKNAVIDSIKYIQNNYDANIYLMPQVIGPHEDNDLIITKEVYAEITNKDNLFVIDNDLTPEELKYVYSQMDLFIGTRMHSNIFSLSEYVPCVAISYDLKTDGIMKDVGLQDYVLNIKNIDSLDLISKINNAIQSLSTMKEILALSIPEISKKSAENNILLFDLINTINLTKEQSQHKQVSIES